MPETKKYLSLQFTIFILLNTIVIAALAQPGEIVFTHETKENGLSSTRVNAILKDKKGFYWVNTVNGLQRLDGNRVVKFRHNPADSTSLPNNEMGFVIMEDKKGQIWFHTESGLCIYQPYHRNFKKVHFKKEGEEAFFINSFFQDSKGLIWMVVKNDGLYFFDTLNNVFKSYTTTWPEFPARVLSIEEDKVNGYYWLNTEKGIAVYDGQKKVYYYEGQNPKGLQCLNRAAISSRPDFIYTDNNDIIWIQTNLPGNGSVTDRYEIKKNELITVRNKSKAIGGFLTDLSGTTWAFGNWLARYDKKTNRFIEIPKKRESQYGIDFNEIQNMYADDENNIFIMTDMGMYTCNPGEQFITSHNILATVIKESEEANINGFVEINDGHLIALGGKGEGLYFFDTSFTRTDYRYGYHPSKFSDKHFLSSWCGLQDSKGIIWIGCEAGRLFQLNTSTNRIITLQVPELEDHTIRSMTEDKNGNIWMGTNNNIIVKWNRQTSRFRQIIHEGDKKIKPEWVLRILPGYENDLWVATTGAGLLRIDLATDRIAEQFLPGNSPQSISSYYVVDILAMNSTTYAVATESGIDLFDWRRKIFSHITEQDGLPSTGIYSMMKDDRNNLWFTSVDGLSKIRLPDKRIKTFSARNGITSEDYQTETDYKYANVLRMKNNVIVFGNPRGFVSFNPASLNETDVPADPLITGFQIFDKNLSIDSLFQKGKTIWLTYAQNYITIQYASLKNVFNPRPEYYHLLEGFDKDWVKGSASHEAIYTYLPGGDYTFKIKCISVDGVPSKNITSFSIHVRPPFYRTWWFFTLITIFILSATWAIYRQRVNKLLAVEKIRTKVARDLHDDMGSVLSTINILSTMAKTKMADDPVKASEYVGKISDNSQRMMEAMDDIVWSIKPDNDNMQKITARMREFATSILETKDIELDFKVEENVNDIKLDMEDRRDFFLIFKEAVNNVAKYSHCDKCAIHVSLHQHRLLLDVQDNGVGFEVDKVDSGNGLSNIQKRAEALKGRATIQSKPGEGTHVTLNIPVQ